MARPIHISGLSAVYESGLSVQFTWCLDYGFDPVSLVEDLNGNEIYTETYYGNTVRLVYPVPPMNFDTYEYRVTFESGAVHTISIYVPGAERTLSGEALDSETYTRGQGTMYDYRQMVFDRSGNSPQVTYSALPILDPDEVFSYPEVWTTNDSSVFADFSGNTIAGQWKKKGFGGGKVSTKTTETQQAIFIAAVGVSEDTKGGLLLEAMKREGGPIVFGTVWARDIQPIPTGDYKDIPVCNDTTDTQYFRTVGTDCAGVTIPSVYLDGEEPAYFSECACPGGCDDFEVSLVKSNPITGADGSFTLTVLGAPGSPQESAAKRADAFKQGKSPSYPALSTYTFTYNITSPSGVVYNELLQSPASATTYTFAAIEASELPWKIEVTESASGCKKTYYSVMKSLNPSRSQGTCHDTTAINYDPSVVETCDDCCITCNRGSVEIGGIVTGDELILNTAMITGPASSETTSDGVITFSGALNTGITTIGNFVSGYYLELISVSGNGGPINVASLVDDIAGLSTPSHTFTGLLPGWYAVRASAVGHGCQSVYYVEIPVTPVSSPCDVLITYNIDPCSGQFTASVESDAEVQSVVYVLNGINVGTTPPVVEAGESIQVVVSYPFYTGCDKANETFGPFTASELDCEEAPAPVIPGCMDEDAVNFNPNANFGDNSCFYGVVGCMDPTSLNFNQNATINDGTCLYGTLGCLDPDATNYNPNATVSDDSCLYLCTEDIISTVTVADLTGIPTITFTNEPTTYTATWEELSTGVTTVLTSIGIGPVVTEGVYLVTVTDANGCTETFILAYNTTAYFGCTDTNASNYIAAADLDISFANTLTNASQILGEECVYEIGANPCTPITINPLLEELDACISSLSTTYVNMLKAGREKDCNTKDLKVLSMIKYLLGRKGLRCVYNCADGLSPDLQVESCSSSWSVGGISGPNLVYAVDVTYEWGDVVKHPTSDLIYNLITSDSTLAIDPEGPDAIDVWEICTDEAPFLDNTNRIDAYIAFVKDACKDCGLPPVTPLPTHPSGDSEITNPSLGDLEDEL
jgi:hypothetical protein